MTREDKEAIIRRLETMYKEAEDNGDKEALFYAIEAFQENESLSKSVIEASELLQKKRPHGEWIDGKDTCSVCGMMSEYFTQYCGGCGAYMTNGHPSCGY